MDSHRSNYVRKVRRRGRTKWALSYIGADGRRHQEVTEAPTREAAKLLLAKVVRDVIERKVAGTEPRPRIAFSEFARKYLDHQQATVEPASYERDRAVMDSLLPLLGRRMLDEIQTRDLQEYVNRRANTVYTFKDGRTRKIAPGTVQRELIVISGIFSRAIDWEYLTVNPAKKVKIRKYEWRKQRILQLDEEDRLFTAFRRPDRPRRLYLVEIVIVALHTGMREDEILRLVWEDIDLSGRKITVRSRNENPTKGKRTRVIGMSRKVAEILAVLHEAAIAATDNDPVELRKRYVFINPRTRTRYVDTKTGWYASLKDARIEGLRFHDLRHTFATRAVLGGCKLPALQQVLGHRDITTTMRYVHMLGLDLNDVIESMESFESETRKERFDSRPESGSLAHRKGGDDSMEAVSA